jgi:hypothetical protein
LKTDRAHRFFGTRLCLLFRHGTALFALKEVADNGRSFLCLVLNFNALRVERDIVGPLQCQSYTRNCQSHSKSSQ